MLVAVVMDAQQLEVKLMGEVEKAWQLFEAEVDPMRSSKLEMKWKEAKEELNIFRRQQMAGGQDSNRGCNLHGVRQQLVCLAGGAGQGPATRSGRGFEARACRKPLHLPTWGHRPISVWLHHVCKLYPAQFAFVGQ